MRKQQLQRLFGLGFAGFVPWANRQPYAESFNGASTELQPNGNFCIYPSATLPSHALCSDLFDLGES
jgi:hypothetical protein